MEQAPRHLQDCYFFYYSTCKNGANCDFRHEPSALGHETECPQWKEKKCFNPKCSLRHMKIEKKRSQTPCYWEDKGGCRKAHCVYMHKNRRPTPNLAAAAAAAAHQAASVAAGSQQANTPLMHVQPPLLNLGAGAPPQMQILDPNTMLSAAAGHYGLIQQLL